MAEVVEKVGYVEVRPGAHMFWLLQYSNHPDGYTDRPWIIWLQGGPGLPGSGFANYLMFGPKDIEGNTRNTTWLQSASVVYVDNPVGTGFSYLEPRTRMSFTTDEISSDLMSFIITFLQENPEFEEMPLYIFGQSYGGKMATAFAHELELYRKSGNVKCNLKAVAIGNGYVTPVDYLYHCYELLYQMSFLDDRQREMTKGYANEIKAALASNNNSRISVLIGKLYMSEPPEMSSYNILRNQRQHVNQSMYSSLAFDALLPKMRQNYQRRFPEIPNDITYQPKNLDIIANILYGPEAYGLQPVHDMLDSLLYNSSVQVIVYSGQYDVICCTSGALAWVRRLTWPGMKEYHQRKRIALKKSNTKSARVEMYVKATNRFKFYWVLESGHVVPRDVPEVALRMLNRILDDTDASNHILSSYALVLLTTLVTLDQIYC